MPTVHEVDDGQLRSGRTLEGVRSLTLAADSTLHAPLEHRTGNGIGGIGQLLLQGRHRDIIGRRSVRSIVDHDAHCGTLGSDQRCE